MDTEKLVDSLFIACHQPGGMKRRSPGAKTADIAFGTTRDQKSGCSWFCTVLEKTSIEDVLGRLVESLAGPAHIYKERLGGANHMDFRPTI